jgi:hypothetical protein
VAITREQALTAEVFHLDGRCSFTIGPRGGGTLRVERWRRNGATKTWKTRPGEFRVPVKHGMYSYGYLTHHDRYRAHLPADCPALQAAAVHLNAGGAIAPSPRAE